MPTPVVKAVKTQPIGYAPILKYFFEKAGIQRIIDENVELDPRRKILTHGQAAVAMITAILFQVFQLYRICRFADKSRVLKVMFPGIQSKEYFDDRLADSLDAIYHYGIGNLELLITRHMIDLFGIQTRICHNDTTSASVYGDCDNHLGTDSIEITYGHSKKGRDDLKQFVWSLSVSEDAAFPLFQQAYSGNTSDVSTYVAQWQHLIELLGNSEFLYVADCKLISFENMVHIHDHHGFFVAPAPMYPVYANLFATALKEHEQEQLIAYKDRFNRGFEVPFTFCHEQKPYAFRMIVLFDRNLCHRKQATLERRIEKTNTEFAQLCGKLNKYKLKERDRIEKTCRGILKKNNTQGYYDFAIFNDPVITYKNKHRGRAPKQGAEKMATTSDWFRIEWRFDQERFNEAMSQCGYYPLVTNKAVEDLSIEQAMLAHKGQYKNEHTNRRVKTDLNLEPIYLHTPERIEVVLFLFKIALQIAVLIERGARQSIDARNGGLNNFMPNRKDVRNPTSENLLAEFQDVVKGELTLPTGQVYGFVSELTALQRDILSILEIPLYYYSYEFLFNSA
jgi:transposase